MTKPNNIGKQMGYALCETANILYLLDNRQEYLEGIKEVVDSEIKVVKRERAKSKK